MRRVVAWTPRWTRVRGALLALTARANSCSGSPGTIASREQRSRRSSRPVRRAHVLYFWQGAPNVTHRRSVSDRPQDRPHAVGRRTALCPGIGRSAPSAGTCPPRRASRRAHAKTRLALLGIRASDWTEWGSDAPQHALALHPLAPLTANATSMHHQRSPAWLRVHHPRIFPTIPTDGDSYA